MRTPRLGKLYRDGELVIRQGEVGNCMYVILDGQTEIFRTEDDREIILRVAGPNEFFGEMALLEKQVRSASVRARGDATILTVDKRTFLRRIHEDPSLAWRIMENFSQQIRVLADELARLKAHEVAD